MLRLYGLDVKLRVWICWGAQVPFCALDTGNLRADRWEEQWKLWNKVISGIYNCRVHRLGLPRRLVRRRKTKLPLQHRKQRSAREIFHLDCFSIKGVPTSRLSRLLRLGHYSLLSGQPMKHSMYGFMRMNLRSSHMASDVYSTVNECCFYAKTLQKTAA